VHSRRAENGPTVLTEADVNEGLVMMRIVELVEPAAEEILAPLELLAEYDRAHGTQLVDTVAAVVEHPGNLADAARLLGIHANSLRYRLERIVAIAQLDPRAPITRTRLGLGLLIRDAMSGVRHSG
jgi:DNA-binding PucR family transcriptional regulator